nr:cyclophilin-like fold protein [uncultured Carboxylicivirga sp.]
MKIIYSIFLSIAFSLIANVIAAQQQKIKLTINNQTELTATMVDNSSVDALLELIENSPLTIAMSDYGNMEKVGPIGTTLPRNDESITTGPGDLILYQGSALVIYYKPNTWSFTRLGKIDNVTQTELQNILGTGDVTVTLELDDSATAVDEVPQNQFQIYPNPVDDWLQVSGSFQSLSIVDISGQEVMRSVNDRVNVSGLKSGLYFLKIEVNNKETPIRKFIKK